MVAPPAKGVNHMEIRAHTSKFLRTKPKEYVITIEEQARIMFHGSGKTGKCSKEK